MMTPPMSTPRRSCIGGIGDTRRASPASVPFAPRPAVSRTSGCCGRGIELVRADRERARSRCERFDRWVDGRFYGVEPILFGDRLDGEQRRRRQTITECENAAQALCDKIADVLIIPLGMHVRIHRMKLLQYDPPGTAIRANARKQ